MIRVAVFSALSHTIFVVAGLLVYVMTTRIGNQRRPPSSAIGWVVSMTLVGVLLGGIPGITRNIEAIMLVIVGVSVAPLIISAIRTRLAARKATSNQETENA